LLLLLLLLLLLVCLGACWVSPHLLHAGCLCKYDVQRIPAKLLGLHHVFDVQGVPVFVVHFVRSGPEPASASVARGTASCWLAQPLQLPLLVAQHA
jgi:hypothetical protein